MSDLVCPKCGRRNTQIDFIEAFCVECYPVKIELPKKLEFERCGRCERIRMKGEWTNYNEQKLERYIVEKCRGDFEAAEYDLISQVASFLMKGSNMRVERTIPIEIKKTICQQCSRMSGGYYEGIIQLRGDPLKVRGHAEMLMKKLAKRTFIAKEEEKDGGLDIYVGNSKAVVEIITELGVKTLITKKLIGRDQGKRLYRTTFLLRF
jgi:nonsense-mediated mRNA decay protein 3